MEKLQIKLDKLKRKLNFVVYQNLSLTDPEVVLISQEMDMIIIQLQRMYTAQKLEFQQSVQIT